MDMTFYVENNQKITAPNTTKIETEPQIKNKKNGKAAGPDSVKNEVYKCLLNDPQLIN